jgi:hypothetical protein
MLEMDAQSGITHISQARLAISPGIAHNRSREPNEEQDEQGQTRETGPDVNL